MTSTFRRMAGCAVVFAGLWAFSFAPAAARCCPFCSMQGQTLTMEAAQAGLVVFGTLANARLNANADALDGGTTDLIIEEVVKDHPFIKGKKTVVLPRYIPVDKNSKVKFLVFVDIFKDRLDPYRGMPVKDKTVVDYIKGAVANKDKDAGVRLDFFFNYLDHPDTEVSTDAYKEFANADHKDVMKMIERVDRAKFSTQVRKWLNDAETPTYRYGLYGYLLGAAGTEKDAGVLVNLLNDPQRGLISGIDGVLAGYIKLRPKEGWQYLLNILADPSKEFTRRYAALRTVRYLWDYQADLIQRKDLIDAAMLLLDQADITDLAIEDLRKWKVWSATDRILALHDKPTHNVPIIQRAILRFALSAAADGNKAAAAFVQEQRKRDPERVKDAEELLRLEPPKAAGSP